MSLWWLSRNDWEKWSLSPRGRSFSIILAWVYSLGSAEFQESWSMQSFWVPGLECEHVASSVFHFLKQVTIWSMIQIQWEKNYISLVDERSYKITLQMGIKIERGIISHLPQILSFVLSTWYNWNVIGLCNLTCFFLFALEEEIKEVGAPTSLETLKWHCPQD